MQTIIKSITAESGELYGISDGRRILIGKCVPTLELIRDDKLIGIRGLYKSYKFTIVFCDDIHAENIKKYSRFDLSVTLLRNDGMGEVINIYNPALIEIDEMFNMWTFETSDKELIRKIYGM